MATQTSQFTGDTIDQIEGLPDVDLIVRYRRGLEKMDPRVFELSDEQMDMAFLPEVGVGNWPVRVLIGHLADAELAYSHRMRRAVAEENPVVNPWDENAFVEAGLYADGRYPIAGFVAVIHSLRRWTSEWLATLTPDQMNRRVLHEQKGELSVRRMLAMTTWHLEHHTRYLNAKVCKFLGSPAQGGSCGPSCGCHKK